MVTTGVLEWFHANKNCQLSRTERKRVTMYTLDPERKRKFTTRGHRSMHLGRSKVCLRSYQSYAGSETVQNHLMKRPNLGRPNSVRLRSN